MSDDPRRSSDEARRNARAIMAAIDRARWPSVRARDALELGSGSGEHAIALARRFPEHTWQPSDPDPVQRASIGAWIARAQLTNVRAPLDLDATRGDWPALEPLAVVLAVHVLHMLPVDAPSAIARAAAARLAAGGLLVLHDAFLDDEGAAPSDRMAEFDRGLRARDARWGLRARAAIDAAARAAGLVLAEASAYDGDQHTLVYARPRA